MLAGRLAELSPLALRMTREALAESAHGDLSDALRREALAQAVCAGEPGFFRTSDTGGASMGGHRADERAELPRGR